MSYQLRTFLTACILLIAATLHAQSPASYVRDWTPIKPVTNTEDLVLQSTTNDLSALKTQYLDGLARPYQSVVKTGSKVTGSTSVDAVNYNVYDAYGRETHKYLPFAANSSGSNTSISDGKLKSFASLSSQQYTFNYQQYGAQGDVYYYGKTDFETSGLERPVKSYAPGNNWVGAGAYSETKYEFNSLDDAVRIWDVDNPTTPDEFGTYTSGGIYPAGLLYKTTAIDEHGKNVVEFKDKSGKVILKRVQIGHTPSISFGAWLHTYYIYDNLGQLRAVIQPEGAKQAKDGLWSLSSTILNQHCFRYEYDARGRMSLKKVPGAGKVSMIYDARDRLAMVNSANEPFRWLVTVYDNLNRPIQTGMIAIEGSPWYLQTEAWDEVNFPGNAYGAIELLSETHYDDYTSLPSGLSSTFLTTWNGEFSSTNYNVFPYPEMAQQSALIQGRVAWTKVRILGTDPEEFLTSVMIYDESGRVIQVQSKNQSGGIDVTTTQYSWKGLPLITVQKHERSGTGAQTVVSVSRMTYDELGRITKTEKKVSSTLVNSGAMPSYKTISEMEYDALGQLKKKKLAPAYNSNAGLESLSYDYNIRGWMLGMNRVYLTDGLASEHYFGFELGYDKTNTIAGRSFAASMLDGNITGMVWKSKGDLTRRKYDFVYDKANRLWEANFEQEDNGSTWSNSVINYSMKMGDGSAGVVADAYDANGNIRRMQQWGYKLGGSIQVDDLNYEYFNDGNQLKKVTDAVTTANQLGDFTDAGTEPEDYAYDDNGNLIVDQNKSILEIRYNHLNLPEQIKFDGKGQINYVYDAAGNKLRKIVMDETGSSGTVTTTTDYMPGGLVYENDVWQYMPQEEGRIRYKAASGAKPSSLQYDYMLKDHLGNVRAVLTEETDHQVYQATMETANRTVEDALFTNIGATEAAKPTTGAGFDSDGGNEKVSKVFSAASGSSQRMGPGVVLKVMAGDKFTANVYAWYEYNNTSNTVPAPATPLINLITNGFTGGMPAGAAHSGAAVASSGVTATPLGSFLTYQNGAPYTNTRPKAFLSWIVLDEEQFKLVDGNYGSLQVPAMTGSSQKELMQANSGSAIEVKKNGYLYVYVSNESEGAVFFDDLRVEHIRGPLLEETHYYPFGLTMKGISSKALNGVTENNVKFSNQLLDNDLGMNFYQMKFRTHDPQIGRFLQVDPLAPQYVQNSTFAYAENQVIRAIDIEGLEKLVIIDREIQTTKNTTVFSVSVEFVTRNNQLLNNNITLHDPPEIKNFTVTKETLRVQNNVNINGKKLEIDQVDAPSNFERHIKKFGIIKSATQSVKKAGDPAVSVGDIVNEAKGSSVIGRGEDFNQPGDTYFRAEGWVSGSENLAATSMKGVENLASQVNSLYKLVGGFDLEKIRIDLFAGNQRDLGQLDKMKEGILKVYPSATVTTSLQKDRKSYSDTYIHYNSTISVVK